MGLLAGVAAQHIFAPLLILAPVMGVLQAFREEVGGRDSASTIPIGTRQPVVRATDGQRLGLRDIDARGLEA
jgi:hypothetical protein